MKNNNKTNNLYEKIDSYSKVNIVKGDYIKNSNDLYNYIKPEYENINKEVVFIVGVNSKNRIIYKELLHIGGLDYSMIDIRNLFKTVLINDLSGFFMAHNHPSGDTTPSNQDLEITKKILDISQKLQMRFLDHIIVNSEYNNFYSMFDNGDF